MRATFGSRSGPITINATTPMTASLESPRSIMAPSQLSSGTVLFARLDVDRRGGLVGHVLLRLLRRHACRPVLFATLHAVLEAFDGLAQVGTRVLELAGAEHQDHHHQHDQPVPNTKR